MSPNDIENLEPESGDGRPAKKGQIKKAREAAQKKGPPPADMSMLTLHVPTGTDVIIKPPEPNNEPVENPDQTADAATMEQTDMPVAPPEDAAAKKKAPPKKKPAKVKAMVETSAKEDVPATDEAPATVEAAAAPVGDVEKTPSTALVVVPQVDSPASAKPSRVNVFLGSVTGGLSSLLGRLGLRVRGVLRSVRSALPARRNRVIPLPAPANTVGSPAFSQAELDTDIEAAMETVNEKVAPDVMASPKPTAAAAGEPKVDAKEEPDVAAPAATKAKKPRAKTVRRKTNGCTVQVVLAEDFVMDETMVRASMLSPAVRNVMIKY